MVGDGARAPGRRAGVPPRGRRGQRAFRVVGWLVTAGEADSGQTELATPGNPVWAARDLRAAGRSCRAVAVVGGRAGGGAGSQRGRDGGRLYRGRAFARGCDARDVSS